MNDSQLIMVKLDEIQAKLDALALPAAPGKKLLTIAEAAERYNVSTKTLYRMKNVQARVGPTRRGVRIKADALERLMNQRDRLA
jgi:hypothetical protein